MFKKLFKKNLFRGDDYGKVIVEEIIPIFHDYARTSNKTILRLKKMVSENKGEFMNDYSTTNKVFNSNRFVTQNEKPIKIFDTDFNEGEFDLTFAKDGYEVGMCYEFKGLGYLGNLSNSSSIKLVTDQYVVFDNGNSVSLYSYEELDRLVKARI